MRCRPGEEDESAGDPQRIAVTKACELILDEGKRDGTKWSVKSLAKEVGLTESHFCRVFKKVMGVTVGEYRAQVLKKRKSGENEGVEVVEVAPRKAPQDVQVAASPFEYQNFMVGLQTQDSFDSELARNWQDFRRASDPTGTVDMFPGLSDTDFVSFNFSPALLSDASTPAMTEDGFQFLNFDEGGP